MEEAFDNRKTDVSTSESLVEEFATRDALSTLKSIEKKLDKLQSNQGLKHSPQLNEIYINKNPISDSINKNPFSDAISKNPFTEAVNKNPFTEALNENPFTESTNKNPFVEAAKKPYTEAINKNPVQKATPSNNLIIKCTTPPVLEEILKDVSSKVDVMFDRMSKDGDFSDEETTSKDLETFSEDYVEDQAINDYLGKNQARDENEKDLKLLKKLLKRIKEPCKSVNESLEIMKKDLWDIRRSQRIILKNLESNNCSSLDSIHRIHYPQVDVGVEIDRNENSSEKSETSTKSKGPRDSEVSLNPEVHQKPEEPHKPEVSHGAEIPHEAEVPQKPEISQRPGEPHEAEVPKKPKVPQGSINKQESCEEVVVSGLYEFNNIKRFCQIVDSKAWTVIQRRGTSTPPTNFNRYWSEYKQGFGDLTQDFWFGNDLIRKVTQNPSILRVELEDFQGRKVWAQYDKFRIGPEELNYILEIGDFSGNASDSFSSHDGAYFSTFDRKNDGAPDCCPCAVTYGGGWWFDR